MDSETSNKLLFLVSQKSRTGPSLENAELEKVKKNSSDHVKNLSKKDKLELEYIIADEVQITRQYVFFFLFYFHFIFCSQTNQIEK